MEHSIETSRSNLAKRIFGASPALIGMVHARALPGTPHASESVDRIAEIAVAEARSLEGAGFDAIIVENMHDRPYVHGDRLGPETVACMTRVVWQVVSAVSVPVGVQILSGGNRHAIAVAQATGAGFIRCENLAYAHVADEGLLAEAEAGPLLRYRRSIDADRVAIVADIKKKHASHAITGDLSIEEAARGAAFFGADAVIVTGTSTGLPTDVADVDRVAAAVGLPVCVGSGATPDDMAQLAGRAQAIIVGSAIKQNGLWSNELDPDRIEATVRAFRDAAGR